MLENQTVIRRSSAWPLERIEDFLEAQRIPIRLACLTPRGSPIVCSLWYLYADKALWCATQKASRVARYLHDHPQCGFEIAPESPPYRGVRGQGQAELLAARGPEVLGRLIDRYLGSRDSDFARWLIGRAHQEVAIRIAPEWLTSWDFSSRMPPIRS